MPVIQWTMSVEFFCLIVVIILMLNYYDRRWAASGQSRLYSVCLWLSAATIALNMACVFTIDHFHSFPLWVNLLLNSGYFALVLGMSTVTAYYLLRLILEHVYNSRCRRVLSVVLAALYAFYALLLLLNLRLGFIFYFDRSGVYCRGPLINVGYAVMGVELALLVLCALKNRRSISQPMRRVMQILPPTVVLLVIYQILYPDVLFNGSIIVAADMILLLNFQSRRVETDSLTCIHNRTSFYHELTLRLAGEQHFQVLVIALKQFTFINQHYGHRQGDSLLYDIACWLTRVHREGKAFRVGNVDATIGCLVNHEVPQMEEEGFEVNYFDLDDYGVPTYYEGVFLASDEMIENEELLHSQYELLGENSRWPNSYNEVLIVVDERNQLDDYTLFALGLTSPDELFDALIHGDEFALFHFE